MLALKVCSWRHIAFMPTAAEIIEVVRSSSSKREAANRLQTSGNSLSARINVHIRELVPIWKDLPADGAFAGKDRTIPKPARTQLQADALVAEAVQDSPLYPHEAQRANVARLIFAMFAITGSMNFPRGWARAVILAFEAAGAKAPTNKAIRWYRSRIAEDPEGFASIHGVDPQLVADIDSLRLW